MSLAHAALARQDQSERSMFLIPEANYPKFEREIEKLSRRAEKLMGETIRPVVFGREQVEISKGVSIMMIQTYLEAIVPVIDGWTFVARIDHSNDSGNLIRTVPNLGYDVPERFRTSAPDCQHCRVRRLRRDTFVICNDTTGEFQQIGSTCLKDFFGHDPMLVAKMAELLGYATEAARGASGYEAGLADRRWINMSDFLAATAQAVRNHGWVSVKASKETGATTTKERAFAYLAYEDEVTAEDRALVERSLAWAQTLIEKADRSDYEHNVAVIANSAYIEERSVGVAASIVGVTYQNERRMAGTGKAVEVGSLTGLIALIDTAKAAGLKAPKIALQLPNGMPVALNVAGPSAKAPGTINITDGGPFGSNVWYGRVDRTGRFTPSRMVTEANRPSILALLSAMAVDPAKTATLYGRLTGKCCFCSRKLTDERSTEVGYGSTCASNYGLAWG